MPANFGIARLQAVIKVGFTSSGMGGQLPPGPCPSPLALGICWVPAGGRYARPVIKTDAKAAQLPASPCH